MLTRPEGSSRNQKYAKELADLVMAEVVSLASMVASKKASLPWICLGPQFYSLCTEKVALTPGNKSHMAPSI